MNESDAAGTRSQTTILLDYGHGFDLLQVFIMTSISLSLFLNILALLGFANIKKTGHVISVMGLASSNTSACVSVLMLFVVSRACTALGSLLIIVLLSSYLVSATSVLCISVGRLVAVSLPLQYNKMFSMRRMTVTMVMVWLSSLVFHTVISLTVHNVFPIQDIGHTMSVTFRPYLLTYGTIGLFSTVVVYGSVIVVLVRKRRPAANSVDVVCARSSALEMNSVSKAQLSSSRTSLYGETSSIKEHMLVTQCRQRPGAAGNARGVSQLVSNRAVAKLGALVLVHIVSGMISLLASGLMGDNFLSNSKTFGVTIFTMGIASIFDSLFYMTTMVEARNSFRKMFKCTANQ